MTTLRDAARALSDIVMQQCGGYTSGPGFEAAEKARALAAALSAPQPAADERVNFEAWYCSDGNYEPSELDWHPKGFYLNADTENFWQGWCARALLAKD